MSRTRHNGRAARVHVWLLTQPTPRTPREILDAVEPDGRLDQMCATLGGMVNAGKCERIGGNKGKVRFRALHPVAHGSAGTVKQKAPAKRPAISAAEHADPSSAPTHSRQRPRPTSAAAPRLATQMPAPRRSELPNFVSPVSWFTTAYMAKRIESEQIANDIARFEQAGGRVEQLPPGETRDPLKFDYDR